MKEWLLIDGFNMAFRNFYAVPELTRADGFPTNMLHGWVKMMWKLQDLYPNAQLVVVYDSEKESYRDKMLPSYKANRQEAPESFRMQLPEIFRLTELMGMPSLKKDGYEADDLLAAKAIELAQGDATVYLVSADKDLAQCLNEKIKQLLPPPTANPKLGWRLFEAKNIPEKFGVRENQIPDYLALMGDSSDNIIGIAGVGPKTASKWLNEHGSLENIIAHANELKPERFAPIILEQAERLRLNLHLTTLQTDIEQMPVAESPFDLDKLVAYLDSMELKSAHNEAIRRYKNKIQKNVSSVGQTQQLDLF